MSYFFVWHLEFSSHRIAVPELLLQYNKLGKSKFSLCGEITSLWNAARRLFVLASILLQRKRDLDEEMILKQ